MPNQAITRSSRATPVFLVNPVSGSDLGEPTTADAVIANGASLSGAVTMTGGRLARITMPAAWTAASLTFQASSDGATYGDLYDKDGVEYTVSAAASREIIIPLVDFLGVAYLKVRSGTSGTPVNQGAARTLKLVLVP